jgi:hypothetical protein
MSAHTEPPSWLTLELHALGELSPEEAAAVEDALENDALTGACRQRIDAPVKLRPLDSALASRRSRWIRARVRWVAPLAAAAAALLFLAIGSRDDPRVPTTPRVKGGVAAISLLRERSAIVDENPKEFAAGDRFKVLLTCPTGQEGVWEIVVFQAGRAFFPLEPVNVTACGNSLPVEGAFAIDGVEPVTVCAVALGSGRARKDIERLREDALSDEAPCVTLKLTR